MKSMQSIVRHLLPVTLACTVTIASATANANTLTNIRQTLATYTMDSPHWYAGANIGVSHLYDSKTPGTTDSVNENGPGFNVDAGYQFNSALGVEGGFNKYHNSRETTAGFNIAQTEHYSAYLAATGRYPLAKQFSLLGKLGAAYSYANKIFNAGPAMAANSVSPYFGLGIDYSLTQKIDFIGQWTRALGNHLTGSADLWSVGIAVALV